MVDSQNAGSTKNEVVNDISRNDNIPEDEINLIDYFRILWKRKWFIFSASAFPTLVVGLAVIFWPGSYTISYTYNISNTGIREFKTLETKFYSFENMQNLFEKLQEGNFDAYAQELKKAQVIDSLKRFISFQVSPSFIEPSEIKDYEELQKVDQVKGALLDMRIMVKSKEDIRDIAFICRNNFEQVIPIYSEKEQLRLKIIQLKNEMADIEESRYSLDLQLKRYESILEKLKASNVNSEVNSPSEIIFQFNNAAAEKAFLPLAYQVQAVKTQIIDLENQIRANKEKYDYYLELLKLNNKLLIHIENSSLSYYTLGDFHVFLTGMLANYNESQQPLQEYLNAYLKRVENKMANVNPLVQSPQIYPIPKGTVRNSALVFAVALMISVFASFFLEQRKRT